MGGQFWTPIDIPDHHRVTRVQLIAHLGEFGPLRGGTGYLVHEDLTAPMLLKRIYLQCRVLVCGMCQ